MTFGERQRASWQQSARRAKATKKIITLCVQSTRKVPRAAVIQRGDMQSVRKQTARLGDVNCDNARSDITKQLTESKSTNGHLPGTVKPGRRGADTYTRPPTGVGRRTLLLITPRTATRNNRGDVACQEPVLTRRWRHRPKTSVCWQPIQSVPCVDESRTRPACTQ